jgi:hypothetical protein
VTREACIELARDAGRNPDEVIEWWTERAAIREFEAGEPREAAEHNALDDVRAALRKGPKSAMPDVSVGARRHK